MNSRLSIASNDVDDARRRFFRRSCVVVGGWISFQILQAGAAILFYLDQIILSQPYEPVGPVGKSPD